MSPKIECVLIQTPSNPEITVKKKSHNLTKSSVTTVTNDDCPTSRAGYELLGMNDSQESPCCDVSRMRGVISVIHNRSK